MKSIVVLGGAFLALENVNPAAEANVIPTTTFCELIVESFHVITTFLFLFRQCTDDLESFQELSPINCF